MKNILAAFLIAIGAVVANIYNPSHADFVRFAAAQVKQQYPQLNFSEAKTGTGLDKLFANIGELMINKYIDGHTVKKDYYVFSVFELDMNDARTFGINSSNVKVLGVFGQFLPLPTN